jgi:hypothetical protein
MFYALLTSPMRATCPTHLILLALITLTILSEEYKPCSSSLCNFLQPPVILSLLGPNILLNTLFSIIIIIIIPEARVAGQYSDQAAGWTTRVRFQTGKDSSLLHNVQTGSGNHLAFYPMGTEVHSSG